MCPLQASLLPSYTTNITFENQSPISKCNSPLHNYTSTADYFIWQVPNTAQYSTVQLCMLCYSTVQLMYITFFFMSATLISFLRNSLMASRSLTSWSLLWSSSSSSSTCTYTAVHHTQTPTTSLHKQTKYSSVDERRWGIASYTFCTRVARAHFMLHASPTLNMSSRTDTHVHMARMCLANILHNCIGYNQQRLCWDGSTQSRTPYVNTKNNNVEKNTFRI